MSTATVSEAFGPYQQMDTSYDPETRSVWLRMHSSPRPCFTPALLSELRHFQRSVAEQVRTGADGGDTPIHYFVAASDVPGVFNLGGDLDLFTRLITSHDRDGLERYARSCIDVLHANAVNLGSPVTTIALVQGSALGGGFEAALSSSVLVAERGSEMGLPEILFNLFPGMGAYNLLARRLDPVRAEKMILSGNIYSAEELYELGVVDVLAEKGEGEKAVREYIKKHSRQRNGYMAMQTVRQIHSPIRHEELIEIAMVWVEAALRLEAKDLRMIERLVRAQNRRMELGSEQRAAAQHVA